MLISKGLRRLRGEPSVFHQFYYLLLGDFAGYRENLIGVGRIHLPRLNGLLAVQCRCDGFDAAAVVLCLPQLWGVIALIS